jgi:AcrR family transcriptional regulator
MATRKRPRRAELLTIAAELFAARGFANVTVDDLGAAAGVSGPALYHHFSGKEALLGEMLAGISQYLLDGGQAIVADGSANVLDRLVAFHATFAVDDRALITVYFRDLVNATDDDQRRIRRLQAQYAALWIDELMAANSALDKRTAAATVHATFGLLNSTPFASTLPRAPMLALLNRLATASLHAAS